MNALTLEAVAQWGASYPLKPGDLPDDTFMTAEGLRRQTVNLSELVVTRSSDYMWTKYPARLRIEVEAPDALGGCRRCR